MAKGQKPGFMVYFDVVAPLESLTDAEYGQLMRFVAEYARTMVAPSVPDSLKIAFAYLKQSIDADDEKYKEKQKTGRESVEKRWGDSTQTECIGNDRSQYQRIGNDRYLSDSIGDDRSEYQGIGTIPSSTSSSSSSTTSESERERSNEDTPPVAPQGATDADEPQPRPAPSKPESMQDRRFSEFWDFYPRKVGKAAAERAYRKIRPDADQHKAILTAIVKQKRGEQWTRENGRYIPNPATWLNQGRWEDEVPDTGPGAREGAKPGGTPQKAMPAQQYAQREYDDEFFDAFFAVGGKKAARGRSTR